MSTAPQTFRGLTASQIETFHREGYLILPDLFCDDDLQPAIDDLHRAIDAKAAELVAAGELSQDYRECGFEDRLARISRETDAVALSLWNGVLHGPGFFRLISNPKLLDAAESLCGEELIASSVYRLRPKIPHYNYGAVPWHQDSAYFEPYCDKSLVLIAWIPLVDADAENGCLWVIPGSHKWALYDQRPHDNPDEFDFAGESYGFDDSGEIPVEVQAGDVVFFNGYLLHRSRKNRSADDYRRVLVNHYMNAWSRLPWQTPEGETAARADFRDIVMICGEDPYAWKGIEDRASISLRKCKAIEERQSA